MMVYPAIDIRAGCCVRLTQGDYEKQQVYSDSPAEIAKGFEQEGAQFLHMVDLDGAKAGCSQNLDTVKRVVEAVKMPVQLGGGIRTMGNIEEILTAGVSRVILGTAAVANRRLVEEAVVKYGNRIAVGIDAKNGIVAVEGWTKSGSHQAVAFARMMQSVGVSTIIYTDIARDGMLQGPNLAAMEEMAENLNIDVIASGGVTELEDIERLKQTGVSGIIVGKALYAGRMKLTDALLKAL